MAFRRGTNGNDTINGTGLQDTLIGLLGNDVIDGKGGNDLIYGDDSITSASGGNDTIDGHGGNDTIYAGAGSDLVLISSGGGGRIDGGAGGDSLYGSKAAGNVGADSIYGGAGNWGDYVDGNGGNDLIYGGTSNTSLADGNDTLFGDFGDDTIYGGAGNDRIDGGGDADVLNGNAGNDTLFGGSGVVSDTLSGGLGADVFLYTHRQESDDSPATARDIITDFNPAQGDRLDLRQIDANTSAAGDQAFIFGLRGPGGVWTERVGADLLVLGNIAPYGTGSDGDPEFIIVLDNYSGSLTAANFLL